MGIPVHHEMESILVNIVHCAVNHLLDHHSCWPLDVHSHVSMLQTSQQMLQKITPHYKIQGPGEYCHFTCNTEYGGYKLQWKVTSTARVHKTKHSIRWHLPPKLQKQNKDYGCGKWTWLTGTPYTSYTQVLARSRRPCSLPLRLHRKLETSVGFKKWHTHGITLPFTGHVVEPLSLCFIPQHPGQIYHCESGAIVPVHINWCDPTDSNHQQLSMWVLKYKCIIKTILNLNECLAVKLGALFTDARMHDRLRTSQKFEFRNAHDLSSNLFSTAHSWVDAWKGATGSI